MSDAFREEDSECFMKSFESADASEGGACVPDIQSKRRSEKRLANGIDVKHCLPEIADVLQSDLQEAQEAQMGRRPQECSRCSIDGDAGGRPQEEELPDRTIRRQSPRVVGGSSHLQSTALPNLRWLIFGEAFSL
jgi:hypothetical protein